MKEKDLRALLDGMTLGEKVNQLVQLPGSVYEEDAVVTGGLQGQGHDRNVITQAGSTLGIFGADKLRSIQEEYMKRQPHHIPLMFMLDVIHGYRTIFPCPLGQGAGFSPELSREGAEIAARECAAGGLHVTFSPMADLVRDARWGRVMESTGEDAFLNGRMAAAMVIGFQGGNSGEAERVSSCVKHFAAYGAAAAGRDYQNAEISEQTLRDFYLPAYAEAVKAGCDMVMTSFNTWNGVPCTANKRLLRDVLRGEMGFEGVLISDWAAIAELVTHGFCEDMRAAAKAAIEAGVDIDMCAGAYAGHLKELVESGEVDAGLVNDAAWRVLCLKNRLGLFENPFKSADEQREREVILCAGHREAARNAVRQSVVLLKNGAVKAPAAEKASSAGDFKDNLILPLTKGKYRKIAFIGPHIDGDNYISSWAVAGRAEDNVSIREAAREVFGDDMLIFSRGCPLLDNHTLLNLARFDMDDVEYMRQMESLLAEAVSAAKGADVAVLCLGEHRLQSGEATSKTDIRLPAVQRELLRRIYEVNRNIVTVLFNGRPLDLRETAELSSALVEAWLPGTEGGHGVVDVLTGAYNPSGRLPMSFPYCVGQLPIHYNSYNTGRPKPADGRGDYTSRYLDAPNGPLYPFGFGLSYTSFDISGVLLDAGQMGKTDTLRASVTVKNTGTCAGTQVLQLYLRDMAASRIRPVKELKGFRRVTLQPGQEQLVTFEITEDMLRFHTDCGSFASEPGRFRVWIGDSSATENAAEFVLR